MLSLQDPFFMAGVVGVAGALGALARYLIGQLVAAKMGACFPWGTLFINLSGAFFIGLLFGLTGQKVVSTQVQTILATGFLGGYTTFSTMSWEGIQLLKRGNMRQSLYYLGGNFIPGLLAAALGLMLGEIV